MIRQARISDAEQICAIYNYYIENSIVTFEEEFVSISEMQERISSASEKYPWLVFDSQGSLGGYAYASAWQSRCSYRFAVESSVYIAPNYTRQGIGESLYLDLIRKLKNTSCHCIIAGMSLPNESSLALHQKLGFKKIGQFEQVGWKFKKWIDVAYWELLL